MKNILKRMIAVLMVVLVSFSSIVYTGNNNFTASAASSKTVSIKTKPIVKASDIKATTVKLSWGKTKGATQYRVYKSTDKKKWKFAQKTTKTFVTVKNLKENKKYYFCVRAYKTTDGKTTKSPYSKAIAVTTKKITATGTTSKLSLPEYIYISDNYCKQTQIGWSKVEGADGFRVYKYNKDKSKWTKIADVTKQSFTFKSLEPGTTYKFAVRPYIKSDDKILLSKSKKVIYASTRPESVENIKTEFIDQTTLKVSWKKQASETIKYVVHYSADSYYGEGHKFVETTDKNYCLIKGLNKNNGYIVFVAGYNVVKNEKCWGDTSSSTVPQNLKNKYDPVKHTYTKYELMAGKWEKTVIENVFERDGAVLYDCDGYGTLRYACELADAEELQYSGVYDGSYCSGCGYESCKPRNEVYKCPTCRKTLKSGACHSQKHS